MKKLLLSVVFFISIVSTMNSQPQHLGKVSAQELTNISSLIKYYNDLPMTTLFIDLPEDRMITLMKAVDSQCESAYLLNKIYATEPNSTILEQAIKENIVEVPGGRLLDYTKILMRYNDLKY